MSEPVAGRIGDMITAVTIEVMLYQADDLPGECRDAPRTMKKQIPATEPMCSAHARNRSFRDGDLRASSLITSSSITTTSMWYYIT